MTFHSFFKRAARVLAGWPYKRSYSQSGEDLIVSYLLANVLGIENPSYLDVGAHHPVFLNNTYLFYARGCRGVCVEPDPQVYEQLRRTRKRDVCLNVGIGRGPEGFRDFYVFDPSVLSTFSETERDRHVALSYKVREVVGVRLVPISSVLSKYFDPWPTLVSLDTEGLEMEILQSLDFEKHRPEVFCIETAEPATETKVTEIEAFLSFQGYRVYADTFINTIFVKESSWAMRRKQTDR